MLRVQVNRGLDGKFQKLENMLDGYRDLYLSEMASQLVLYSPVDTGTYITGHHIKTTAVGASRSSEGKPRQQPYEQFAQDALNELSVEISQLPEAATQVVFSNDTFHSDEVEYEHGYAPYRKTAREHSRAADKAAAEARAGNR